MTPLELLQKEGRERFTAHPSLDQFVSKVFLAGEESGKGKMCDMGTAGIECHHIWEEVNQTGGWAASIPRPTRVCIKCGRTS